MNDKDKDLSLAVKNFLGEHIEKLLLKEREEYLKKEKEENNTKDIGNGFYTRNLFSSFGFLENIKIPRVRKSEFISSLLPFRKRTSSDLDELFFQMYAHGTSTRDIENIAQKIYSANYSRSSVSRMTDVLLSEVKLWKNRKLEEKYSVIYLDATFFSIRRKYVAKEPIYLAIGVKLDGTREILGFYLFGSTGESSNTWKIILKHFKKRGVKDVSLFVTDDLTELKNTTEMVYPKSKHQLCFLHAMRTTTRQVRKTDKYEIIEDMKNIHRSENKKSAEEKVDLLISKWENLYPTVIDNWQRNRKYYLTYFDYPASVRRFIYTTNVLERKNKEVKRRLKVMESLPSEKSAEKMLYMILSMENEKMLKRKMPNFQRINFFEKKYRRK